MTTAEYYRTPEYDGFETDYRILDAIEEISNPASLLDGSGNTDESSPAYMWWANGGDEEKIISYLDKNYPDWREYAPLCWGEGGINADGSSY